MDIFCPGVPKLTASNFWAIEDVYLCLLGKVHCTSREALMWEVYDESVMVRCISMMMMMMMLG